MKYIVNPNLIELTRAEMQQAIGEFISRNHAELDIPTIGLRGDSDNTWRGQSTPIVEMIFSANGNDVVGCRVLVEVEERRVI